MGEDSMCWTFQDTTQIYKYCDGTFSINPFLSLQFSFSSLALLMALNRDRINFYVHCCSGFSLTISLLFAFDSNYYINQLQV